MYMYIYKMSLLEVTKKPRLSIFEELTVSELDKALKLASKLELKPDAPDFVPPKSKIPKIQDIPIPTGTPENNSVKLTWDNTFKYDFNNYNYFIKVYKDSLFEKKIEIIKTEYEITISELENSKPYYFALFIINKNDKIFTSSYISAPVIPTPLNPSAPTFIPAQKRGGNYEQKYLKYKNKYLQLKKLKK